MGGILNKAVPIDNSINSLLPLQCLSHAHDSSILHDENFKDMRQLLYKAVGFNSREIHKALLTDYYTLGSNHVSLITLQDIFGLHTVKSPKKSKQKKDEMTQYVNILIKSGEFERLNSKKSAFFLVFYLKSNPAFKIASKVSEMHTVKIEWNESISIPIQIRKDLRDELIIEVGNFYDLPQITDNIALEQTTDIKTMRKIILSTSNNTLRKMICKVIATGKVSINDEFLGDMHDLSVKLKKKSDKKFGEVNLQIEVCESPSKEFHLREHLVVNELGLMHDNEINNGTHITVSTEAIIDQHRKLTHLTSFESVIIKWICISKIHKIFSFDFSVLDNIILKLHQFIFDAEFPQNLIDEYHLATKLILYLTLQRIIDFSNDNHAFSVLQNIITIKPPVRKEYPSALNSPLNVTVEVPDQIKNKISESIKVGIGCWWFQSTKNSDLKDLENISSVLDKCVEYRDAISQHYGTIFDTQVQLNLLNVLEQGLVSKITEVIVPPLDDNVKKLLIEDEIIEKELSNFIEKERIGKYFEILVRLMDTKLKDVGTKIFMITKKLHATLDKEKLIVANLSENSTSFWIKEATAKAMICIERAVDFDNFNPIDENSKNSSSSIDFVGILKEFQIFWGDIDQLTSMRSSDIHMKIIQCLQKLIQFYIFLGIKKIQTLDKAKSDISMSLWFTFLHNINFTKNHLSVSLRESAVKIDQSDMNLILNELTIDKAFASNLIQNIKYELGIEKCDDDLLYDELKLKYENIFATFSVEFRDALNFNELCHEIWIKSLEFFDYIVNKGIESCAHIEFYCHLRDSFRNISHICTKFVNDPSIEFQLDRQLERKLFLNATESDDLIEQYYIERYKMQNFESTKGVGILTVSISRNENSLNITILNVKDLVPVEWKIHCDPYVKVTFVPMEHFKHLEKYQTKSKSKTLCALYDETFNIDISKLSAHGNNFIHFMVAEKELVVKVHLGEAFLPLNDFLTSNNADSRQLHLKLTKPVEDSEIIKALEIREHHDKIAKEFLKHVKSQLNHGSWATLQHHLHNQYSISDFIHSHTHKS